MEVVVVVLLFLACEAPERSEPLVETGTFDPGPPDPYEDLHPWIHHEFLRCDPATDKLRLFADTDFPSDEALVWIVRTGGEQVTGEEHALVPGDHSIDVILDSKFTCPQVDFLSVVLRLYNFRLLEDCRAWGDDPEGLVFGEYGGDPERAPDIEGCRIDR